MSEMTARERIAEAAHEAIVENFGGLGWGEVYYEDGHKEAPDTDLAYRIADDITAIVREALLDNWTLIASGKIVQKEPQFGHSEEAGLRAMLVSKMAVEAALDAAFGADDDGGGN